MHVLGQKQNTPVKKKMNSCVFDELLFFNLKSLEPESLEQGQIKVEVYDADTIGRNDLIGLYQFDIVYVYYQKARGKKGGCSQTLYVKNIKYIFLFLCSLLILAP